MGALDQGLKLVTPSTVPPPVPVGVAQLPPAAAPRPLAAAGPQPALPGALGQAMNIMGAARSATAQDPAMVGAMEAADTDQKARDEAAAKIEANMAQIQQLQAQPDAPAPAVPRLKELPDAPVVEHKDPMRVFGQFLPVIAALGALTTREPAVNALNAATAMINAAKVNDKQEEEKQRQSWIDNTKAAVDNNNTLLGQYKLNLEDHNLTVTERMAKINAIAANNRDYVTLAALKSGNLDSLTKFIQLQQGATGQLAGMVNQIQGQQLDRDRLENQELYQAAQLEISRRNASNVSMGDAIGPVLVKIQQAGANDPATGQPKPLSEVLSPGERQALKLYMEINRQAAYSDTPGEGGGGGAPGGLTAITGGGPAGLPMTPPGMAAPAAAPKGPRTVPKNPAGTYLPQTAEDMLLVPMGANFVNPSDGKVYPKRR